MNLELTVVKLHLNVTYYAQHFALKSVDEKSQSVMDGKLFSSYMTVFELRMVKIENKMLLLTIRML